MDNLFCFTVRRGRDQIGQGEGERLKDRISDPFKDTFQMGWVGRSIGRKVWGEV
jgi:hypothetical protein